MVVVVANDCDFENIVILAFMFCVGNVGKNDVVNVADILVVVLVLPQV